MKTVSKHLEAISKSLKAFLNESEFKQLKNEISNIKKLVGLKDHYRNFRVSIGFVSHPDFIVFGGINWDANGTADIEEALNFGEELIDASRKIQKVLELFKKNHSDVKIVKYPVR